MCMSVHELQLANNNLQVQSVIRLKYQFQQ
jgi:hypothetical protein